MIRKGNVVIAITHIIARRKQTFTDALVVTIGVGVYLFMNSLSAGFSKFSRDEIFKNSAHTKSIRTMRSAARLSQKSNQDNINVIMNPQITTLSKKIIDPENLLKVVKSQSYITNAISQVYFDPFYNRGKAQTRSTGNGVNIIDYDAMFS